MRLNNEYSARLLSAKVSKLGIAIETYAIHPTGEYGAVCQVELFKARDGWAYWSGGSWRVLPRQLGELCAKVRNECKGVAP